MGPDTVEHSPDGHLPLQFDLESARQRLKTTSFAWRRSGRSERVDEDVEEHDAGGGEFGAGAEQEAEKGAEGRFDRGRGVFFRDDELCDEGAEKRAQDHPDGRQEDACEKADDGADSAGLGQQAERRDQRP